MPNWKKVIVSGSLASVTGITASNVPDGDASEAVLTINSDGAIRKVAQGTLSGISAGGTDTDWHIGATHLTASKNISLTGSITSSGGASFIEGGITLAPHTSTELFVEGNITASGDIIARGSIIAENYIVSSSVTHLTQSFSSGSTIFGDTSDDTHQFTGSIDVLGSITSSGTISASGLLFASTSDAGAGNYLTVLVDTGSGRFYYTGSYGGAGGSGGGNDNDWIIKDSYIFSSGSVYITGSDDQVSLKITSTRPTGSNVFTILGSSSVDNAETGPELFSVKDVTSGSIFTLHDISGLPIFDVNSDGNITIDGNIEFGGYNNNGNILVSSQTDLNNFSSPGESRGDLVRFGGNGNITTAGELVYWDGTDWQRANQTNAASGSLLGVTCGSTANDGILLRGITRVNNTFSAGDQVLIGSSNGDFTTTLSTTSGNVVRAVGHVINSNVIYFNPSPDFIKID